MITAAALEALTREADDLHSFAVMALTLASKANADGDMGGLHHLVVLLRELHSRAADVADRAGELEVQAERESVPAEVADVVAPQRVQGDV